MEINHRTYIHATSCSHKFGLKREGLACKLNFTLRSADQFISFLSLTSEERAKHIYDEIYDIDLISTKV